MTDRVTATHTLMAAASCVQLIVVAYATSSSLQEAACLRGFRISLYSCSCRVHFLNSIFCVFVSSCVIREGVKEMQF